MSPRDLALAEPPLPLGWQEEHEGNDVIFYNDATGESTLDRCINPDCRAPFVATDDKQRACCRACGNAWDKAQRRKPIERRTCAFVRCAARARGETFTPVNPRQRYCTRHCHMIAQQEAHMPPRRACPICGEEYQPTNRKHRVACPKKECHRAAQARRFAAWYEANKSHHIATTISTRKARDRRAAAVVVVDALRARPAGVTVDGLAEQLKLRRPTVDVALALLQPALRDLGGAIALRADVDVAPLIAVPKRRQKQGPAPQPPRPRPGPPLADAEMPPSAQPEIATTGAGAAPADPWQAPAPSYGTHLPGAAFELRILTGAPDHEEPARWLDIEHARIVHAGVSAAIGQGHSQFPDFSLIPTSIARHGWGVYVADEDVAGRLGGTSHPLRVFDTPGRLRIGHRVRLRAPVVAPGPHRVRLDTVSPVVIKQNGHENRTHRSPTAESLVSALMTVAARLGVTVSAAELRVEVVEHETEREEVFLPKLGDVRGWRGWAVLLLNAPARWLLEAASRIGLGARVAFGFGRVFVRDHDVEEEPSYDTGPVRDRERYEELYLLLTPRQRDILAIFVEAQRRTAQPKRPAGAEGPLFVTPHAVLRYRERVKATDTYEAALAACIDLGARARRIGPAKPDPDTGEPRELWASTTADGRVVPIIVGFRSAPHLVDQALPQMVSVYPVDGHEAAEIAAAEQAGAPPPQRDGWVLTDRAAGDVATLDGCTLGEARKRLLLTMREARFLVRGGGVETWEHGGRQIRVREDGDGVGVVERVRTWT